MKKDVDNYKPNKRIPYCQFFAKFFSAKETIPELKFSVRLIGAREPQNELTVYINPQAHESIGSTTSAVSGAGM